ncbi:3-isopropylmalate dehydratase small subunit [Candidatus Bathyarchaeota archaeon]|nr:3-isopropylmalate dehydratase small subunit [Candidatus Bathyarchaeota archaeon]
MWGKALKYGSDINTDVIIPGQFLVLTNSEELAKHAMEGLDLEFHNKVKERKIIVADKNFGCGSSREQAPIALKYAGVQCILAYSFARIFYRNAINVGLPVLECGKVVMKILDGDELYINPKTGVIKNISRDIEFNVEPVPDFLLKIMEFGLVKSIRERRKN